jgi:arsenate reductase (thioredoxin)
MAGRAKIAFVCLHGSAKSLIAAEFCKRLAAGRGTTLDATTSGPEPDAEIPGNVTEGLLSDGIDVRGQTPRRVSSAGLADATHIVSFGCDLAAIAPQGVPIDRWDDCPAVSDDYGVARKFIVDRIERLLERVALK